MTNSDDEQERQHLRELLAIHTRNARSLKKQIAQFGIEPPIKLINSLEFEQREMQALKTILETFERHSASVEPMSAPAERRRSKQYVERALPMRASLVATPPGQIRRRVRGVARHVHAVSRRGWVAGGIGMVLVVAVLGFALVQPAPNTALIDELRAAQPATRSITVHLADAQAVPPRFDVRAGDVVALFVVNDTAQPCQVVLVDGTLADATSALGAGETKPEQRTLLAPGERSAFPFVAAAGWSYTFASAPPDSAAPVFWGTIVTKGATSGG